MRFPRNNRRLATLPYELGDMRSGNGASLRFEVEQLTNDMTLALTAKVQATFAYQEAVRVAHSPRVALYFERALRDTLRPVVQALCVTRWHSIHGNIQDTNRTVCWDHHRGLGPLLQNLWVDDSVGLRLGPAEGLLFQVSSALTRARSWARRGVRRFRWLMGELDRARQFSKSPVPEASGGARIAVHYTEGVNPARRTAIFWLRDSQLDPTRVIHYLDPRQGSHPRRVPFSISSETLGELDEVGTSWLWVEEPNVAGRDIRVWQPSAPGPLAQRYRVATHTRTHRGQLDRWVLSIGTTMLREVDYWNAFYLAHNVQIHFDQDEGAPLSFPTFAQSIAMDLIGGVHLGNQRSEMKGLTEQRVWGHPDHVFFTWGTYAQSALVSSRNRNECLVVTGFSQDVVFTGAPQESMAVRDSLQEHGSRFVVAAFDDSFNPDIHFSKGMMQAFYSSLLRWALEDPEIGLVFKPKKTESISWLPEVQELLSRAVASGRCVVLDNATGRLPADAAHAADFTIGIGISTAALESAIIGKRAVHCDLPHNRAHPFYSWGYEKVIFDDLDRMMAALRRYKADPASEPQLGDHTPCLDELDPFRDGRAGRRVGSYIRWLLEAFDEGCDRSEAIQRANGRYVQQWGADKVVGLTPDAEDALGSPPKLELA